MHGLSLTVLALVASPASAQYAKCVHIADDRERLACYDAAARASEAAPGASASQVVGDRRDTVHGPQSALAAPIADASPPPSTESSVLGSTWELEPARKRGTFNLLPYGPVYALVHASSHPNSEPSTPTRPPPQQDISLDRVESKIQLSFKTKLLQDVLGTPADLWFGYTQQSYWQAANRRYSSFFRETNYQPEIIAMRALPWKSASIDASYVALSVVHESNGRGESLSRSWNRVIGEVAFESGPWVVHLRPWARVDTASGANDDNPDIQDFVGRGEAIVAFRKAGHVVTFTGRHTLRSGANSRGSARLDWAFPVVGHLNGHLQLFSGYGESLIDYNHRQTTLGFGVSFFD